MYPAVPPTSRPASRVIVLGPENEVLLLDASWCETNKKIELWICPGGGVEKGESWEQAAIREIYEETGLTIDLGPAIFYRRHVYQENDRNFDLFELFFVARASTREVQPVQQDSYISGFRWWTIDEIANSHAEFAPRRLAEYIAPIACGIYPVELFDSGV